MEILTTNTSYAAAIVLTIIFGVLTVGMLITANDKAKSGFERGFATVVGVLAILFVLSVLSDPTVVTYDAIITDWNVVYDQGYEVVETNGKIVTLRKVDE